MRISRTTLDRDLLLAVRPGRGCRAALERALRDAIRSGRLRAGTSLPSTRALSIDLGIARSTVSEAYSQLTAAGYLTATQGAGTRVATGRARTEIVKAPPTPAPNPRFDLRPGVPDLSSFPKALWQRAHRRVLERAGPDVFGRGDARGRIELRSALAEYLARTRAVAASASQLIVTAGFTGGLKLACDTLRARGARRVGIEDPSLWLFPIILRSAGLEPVPIPVDDDGLSTGDLDELELDAVLVTPAHQYPLGATLSSVRRTALLEWAARRGAFVIEDDYDGEFRYDRQPIGAVQGLDPDRVVYGGTAAKTLAPGVRLGWFVMPPALFDAAIQVRNVGDRYSSALDQLTLAELIESGDFDRHVRAMRRQYRNRRDAVVAAVASSSPTLKIRGTDAGLHLLLELPAGHDERAFVSLADKRSIGLHGLSPSRHGRYEGPEGIVIGYAAPAESAFPACIKALASLLRQAGLGTAAPDEAIARLVSGDASSQVRETESRLA